MRFKIRNALLGLGAYIYILFALINLNVALFAAFVIYAVICMIVAKSFIAGAEGRKTSRSIEFSQSGAADSFGIQYGSFHYAFESNETVIEAFRVALKNALKGKLGCSDLHEMTFKDVDRDLRSPETRTFSVITAAETIRKSNFSLLCNFSQTGSIHSVRWWMLVSGARDPNKIFWRYVFSPLSVPFTILPYIRRQYDPLSGLRTIYPGFFNGIDVFNRTREIQYVAFEVLVEVLESFGIDTTDLKIQKLNILNINVSGGQASFGSVVQGAMNKVAGMAGIQKS